MNGKTQKGFTLVELTTAIALTVVLTGSMAGLVQQARHGAALAETQAKELAGFRRAMRMLGADLRAARDVAQVPGRVTIATADGARVWTLQDRTLYRTVGTVVEQIATSVEDLEIEADGACHRVRLRVGVGTVLRTGVAPRLGSER